MTFEQVQWAKQHDWYMDHCKGNELLPMFAKLPEDRRYMVAVWDEGSVKEFTDFQKLKEWAGY